MNGVRLRAVVMGVFLAIVRAGAQDADDPKPPEDPKALTKTVTFTERSEMSMNDFLAPRMGWELASVEAAKTDYKLPEESFEVYTPPEYDGTKPFGLLVFMNPHPSGRPPRHYIESINKHRLICVGPNNAGNGRLVRPRMGLAIDAVHNMRKQYNIDPERIYVTGISGGGRVASMLGVGFADVFRGGLYIIGCNFYRREWSAEQKGYFPKRYSAPPAKVFRMAREQSKHVFLTGDTDGNREQTQIYYNGFKHDRFEHITYLQVPGMGHRSPDAEWFEKGIAALDAPLPKPGSAAAKAAATQRATVAAPAKAAATQAGDPESVAQGLLANARMYVENKLHERAREKLRWIVEKFPQTRAAGEARGLLKGLEGRP